MPPVENRTGDEDGGESTGEDTVDKDFAVETDPSWSVGDTKEWQYKTPEERNELPAIYSAPASPEKFGESDS